MSSYQKVAWSALAGLVAVLMIVSVIGTQAIWWLVSLAAIVALLTLSGVRWLVRQAAALLLMVIGGFGLLLKQVGLTIALGAENIRAHVLGRSTVPDWGDDRLRTQPASPSREEVGLDIMSPN